MSAKSVHTWQRLPRAVILDTRRDLDRCLRWNLRHPDRGLFDSDQVSAAFLVINALVAALAKKSTLTPVP